MLINPSGQKPSTITVVPGVVEGGIVVATNEIEKEKVYYFWYYVLEFIQLNNSF